MLYCTVLYYAASRAAAAVAAEGDNPELCHLYPYPCPKKFYKLPAVLFCYTNVFYKLAWAWAWV